MLRLGQENCSSYFCWQLCEKAKVGKTEAVDRSLCGGLNVFYCDKPLMSWKQPVFKRFSVVGFLFKVKYSLVDGTQAGLPPQVEKYSRLIGLSVWQTEREMASNLAAAVGWKRRSEYRAIWQPASFPVCVYCVRGCVHARVCVFYKSSNTSTENCQVVIQNTLLQPGL